MNRKCVPESGDPQSAVMHQTGFGPTSAPQSIFGKWHHAGTQLGWPSGKGSRNQQSWGPDGSIPVFRPPKLKMSLEP